MIEVEAKFEPNPKFFNLLESAQLTALEQAGTEILTDLQESGTMPFAKGTLQNELTFLDTSELAKKRVKLVSQGPYARRLYFHPEYNFQRADENDEESIGKNPNAGAGWFNPYLNGEKRNMLREKYAALLKRRIGKVLK